MTAAIYARYSSDLQSEASIDDQVRLCRERAAGLGFPVAEVYADAALSGAHAASRPALQRMLADAAAGRFSVLVAEALDRLSRDLQDIAGIAKALAYADVRIITVAEGEISDLHVGLKGTMNALFLKDLAQKIRRGQRGRVEAGRSPGGLAYGYEPVREFGADGEPVRGKRRIREDQARIIRRIFSLFNSGQPARAIAAMLNREGIPSPRGGQWNASTIHGSRARATGILNNPVYTGRLVYDRQTFRKNPATGRRIPRVNGRERWVSIDAPELAIVDAATWEAARRRIARMAAFPPHVQRRPRRLLSGLVECAVCGGPMVLHSAGRLRCSRRVERGLCTNAVTVAAAAIERRVLTAIETRLLSPDMLDAFVVEARAEIERGRRDAGKHAATRSRELGEVKASIQRAVDAIVGGTDSPALRERLRALEARRAALEADAASERRAPPVVELLPRAAEIYREQVAGLSEALTAEGAALVRGIVERVTIAPGERRGEPEVELHGSLAGLMAALGQGEPSMRVSVAAEGFGRQHTPGRPAVVRLKI